MWHSLARLVFLFSALTISQGAHAKLLNWQSNNIQLLRGSSYNPGPDDRTIITLEHANGWAYGDTFFFMDVTLPDSGGTSYYFELAPRFSLSRITGKNMSYGLIKDVLISTALEKGEGTSTRYLVGGAVDLALPGFKFFKTNFYLRDDPRHDGSTYQLTIAWNKSFDLGKTSLLFEGFADLAGKEGPFYRTNEHIVPRFLLDTGLLIGLKPGKLYVGVELDHWRNKFGLNGVTDTVPQLQIKWVLN